MRIRKSLFLSKISNRIFPERPGLNKVGQLRYSLIKQAVGAGAALLFLSAIGYVADFSAEGLRSDRQRLNNKVNNTIGEVNALEGKLTKAEKSLPVYRMLTERYPEGQVMLERQEVGAQMEALKSQYYLPVLRATLAPIKSGEGSKYKNTSMLAQFCDMTLTLEGVSDTHVLQLLRQLKDMLPGGIAKITSLTIARTATPTDALMGTLTQTGKASLVKADVKLTWQGMKVVPKPAKAVPKAEP